MYVPMMEASLPVSENPFVPPEEQPPPEPRPPRAYVGLAPGPRDPGWHAHVEDEYGAMVSQIHADTAAEAVAWARAQCPAWVMVVDWRGDFFWAGTDPRPEDIPFDWDE
jgi:hypothetical protein